jgi:hypothetical protein
MLLVGASAGAERKLKQRAGARHQVDLAVTLQSPSELAASTASGGGGLAIRQDWRRRRICWYIFSGCGREGATDGQRAEAKRKGSEEAEGEQAQDFGVRLQKISHSERP